jgi:hypothetical protein
VGHSANGLEKRQALFGIVLAGSPSELISGELKVIGCGIETSKGQLETILAAWSAVASTGIAAAHVQCRDHFSPEADWRRLIHPRNRHWEAGFFTASGNDQRGVAVFPRAQVESFLDFNHSNWFNPSIRYRGQIANRAVGIGSGYENLLGIADAGE